MVEPAGGFALPAHRNLGDAINGADDPEGMALVDLGAGAAPRTYTYREFDGSPPRSRAAWAVRPQLFGFLDQCDQPAAG